MKVVTKNNATGEQVDRPFHEKFTQIRLSVQYTIVSDELDA